MNGNNRCVTEFNFLISSFLISSLRVFGDGREFITKYLIYINIYIYIYIKF